MKEYIKLNQTYGQYLQNMVDFLFFDRDDCMTRDEWKAAMKEIE